MSPIFSCKNCNERAVGCHATCEKYLTEKEQHEADKERLRHLKAKAHLADAYAVEQHNKMKKKYKRGQEDD